MTDVLAFTLAFALAAALTPAVRKLAIARGIVAVPSRDRWKQTPVALLGGVGLVVSFVATAALVARPTPELWVLLGTCLAIAGMGLYDDLARLRPHTKLVGQIVVAAVLVEFGFQLHVTDLAGINILLTVFWLVGITNAFNLLDNMDGLSAGIGGIGAAFCWVLCSQSGDASLATLAAALTGSLLGFLFYNFHPATIFMGDCGSMFVGLALGGMIIPRYAHVMSGYHSALVLLVPACVFLIPIFDTTYVTVMRTLWGRKVSEGGRDHTSHRLVSLGLSEPQAVLLLYLLAVIAGSLGLLMRFRAVWTVSLLAPLYVLLLVILGVYLSKVAVYRSGAQATPEAAEPDTPLWHVVKYKRRMFEVFLDLILVSAAYYGAYLLRWEWQLAGHRAETFIASLPIVIGVQMAAFWVCGVYRRMWRYTSLDELLVFSRAVVAGTALPALVILFAFRFESYSRTVFIIDALLLFLLLAASRVSFRLLDRLLRRPGSNGKTRRVLIYGAGDAGEFAVREVLNNDQLAMEPIGFIDDDPTKQNARIHGFRVLGTVEELDGVLKEQDVQCLVVSSQRLNGSQLEAAKAVCRTHKVPVKRLLLSFTD